MGREKVSREKTNTPNRNGKKMGVGYERVKGLFGPESLRPWVVSAWFVSALVDSDLGRFGHVFSRLDD